MLRNLLELTLLQHPAPTCTEITAHGTGGRSLGGTESGVAHTWLQYSALFAFSPKRMSFHLAQYQAVS